jgi:hypothetical protein
LSPSPENILSFVNLIAPTPCNILVVEKLTITHLVKNVPASYGTERFTNMLTSVRHWSLSNDESSPSARHTPDANVICSGTDIVTRIILRYQISYNIACTHVKSRRMRWAGHVERMGEESVQSFGGEA